MRDGTVRWQSAKKWARLEKWVWRFIRQTTKVVWDVVPSSPAETRTHSHLYHVEGHAGTLTWPQTSKACNRHVNRLCLAFSWMFPLVYSPGVKLSLVWQTGSSYIHSPEGPEWHSPYKIGFKLIVIGWFQLLPNHVGGSDMVRLSHCTFSNCMKYSKPGLLQHTWRRTTNTVT